MNEASLVVPLPFRLWALMTSIAYNVHLLDKDLLHACLGPRQLHSAINHLLHPLFLAFSSAPCWLQSIIKQIKADCGVNFHLISARGRCDVTHRSETPEKKSCLKCLVCLGFVWWHSFTQRSATLMRQGGRSRFSQSNLWLHSTLGQTVVDVCEYSPPLLTEVEKDNGLNEKMKFGFSFFFFFLSFKYQEDASKWTKSGNF